MFVVRVMPIARGVFKDHLTFFSRTPLPVGSVVTTSVRSRPTPSLVLESKDVREEKLDLKSAEFSLKKISPVAKPKRIFTNAFIAAVKETALWHGVHEGAVLAALTSGVLLSSLPQLIEAQEETPRSMVSPDLLVLQAERGERIRTYRNLAREAFARNASMLILAPTVVEAEHLVKELERGIEESVILLTSEVQKKKLIERWKRVVIDTAPLLIVGTSFALSVPRQNIDTLVIERESARSYRAVTRPHLDVRLAAQYLARTTGARLILADFPLRVETRYRVDTNEVDELARSQLRPTSTALVTVIDERKKDEAKGQKRLFTTLTDETKESIQREVAKGGRAVVFAARRGIAPLTVCNDCGTPVSDPSTGAPMVLHKTPEGNIFMSHRSGATLSAHTSCKNCGGWNLVTLGIGVDRVAEELQKSFPKTPIFVFTRDTTPTQKAAKKLAAQFFGTGGAILVGTERMLPYLSEPVELVAVASLDSILSLSAWRAHEHALSILFYLRERAENELIVETRRPEDEVMKTLASGNPLDFYRKDISEREKYGYPPFTVFIGLSWGGNKALVEKLSLKVSESFKDLDLVGPLPATALGKTEWHARAVIRIAQNGPLQGWPDPSLVERLRALPPDIAITIDPDEIV